MTEPATQPPSPAERFTSLVMHIARLLDDAHDTSLPRGDIAALRREDGATSPAFYKLAAIVFDDAFFPRSHALRDEAERRWARVAHLLARSGGQHVLGAARSLGAALAQAELAEPRLLRLLRSEGESLDVAARAAIAPLIQKAVPFDPRDLTALLLSAPHAGGRFHHEDGESVRRRIARDYYRATAKGEGEAKSS